MTPSVILRARGRTPSEPGVANQVSSDSASLVSDQISIIVPVFNEEATVAAVIDRLLAIPLPAPREIIVVNDGSIDSTPRVLDALGARPELTVVHSDRNRGKGYSVRLGIARA